jgi:hypothetical protein
MCLNVERNPAFQVESSDPLKRKLESKDRWNYRDNFTAEVLLEFR